MRIARELVAERVAEEWSKMDQKQREFDADQKQRELDATATGNDDVMSKLANAVSALVVQMQQQQGAAIAAAPVSPDRVGHARDPPSPPPAKRWPLEPVTVEVPEIPSASTRAPPVSASSGSAPATWSPFGGPPPAVQSTSPFGGPTPTSSGPTPTSSGPAEFVIRVGVGHDQGAESDGSRRSSRSHGSNGSSHSTAIYSRPVIPDSGPLGLPEPLGNMILAVGRVAGRRRRGQLISQPVPLPAQSLHHLLIRFPPPANLLGGNRRCSDGCGGASSRRRALPSLWHGLPCSVQTSRQGPQSSPVPSDSQNNPTPQVCLNKFEHPHSEIMCGAALSAAFFFREDMSLVFCNLKQYFSILPSNYVRGLG